MSSLRYQPPEEVLGCLGYFGFGGGWAKAAGRQYSGQLYCNLCPLNSDCWGQHRERVRNLLPDLVARFEEHVEAYRTAGQGPEVFMPAWFAEYKMGDPYVIVMVGNVEDGVAVYLTRRPQDRAEGTLPWPFKKEDQS